MPKPTRSSHGKQVSRDARTSLIERRKQSMGIGDKNPFEQLRQRDKSFVSNTRTQTSRSSGAATQSRLNEALRRSKAQEASSSLKSEVFGRGSPRSFSSSRSSYHPHQSDRGERGERGERGDARREDWRDDRRDSGRDSRGQWGGDPRRMMPSLKYDNDEDAAGLDVSALEQQHRSGLPEDMKEMRASSHSPMDRLDRYREAEQDPSDPWGARAKELRQQLEKNKRLNAPGENTWEPQQSKAADDYVSVSAKAAELAESEEGQPDEQANGRRTSQEVFRDVIEKSKKWRELRYLERQQIKDSIEEINDDYDATRQVLPQIRDRNERDAVKGDIVAADRALGETAFDQAVRGSKALDVSVYGSNDTQKVRATGKLLTDTERLKRERDLLEKKEQKRKEAAESASVAIQQGDEDDIKESNFGEAAADAFAPLPYELDPDFEMQSSDNSSESYDGDEDNEDNDHRGTSDTSDEEEGETKFKGSFEAEEEEEDDEEEEEEEGEWDGEEESSSLSELADRPLKLTGSPSGTVVGPLPTIPTTISLPQSLAELESLLSQFPVSQELYIYDRIAKCNSTKVKVAAVAIQDTRTRAKEEGTTFAGFLKILLERTEKVAAEYDGVTLGDGERLEELRLKLNNLQRIIKFVISDVPAVSAGHVKNMLITMFNKTEDVLSGNRKAKTEGSLVLPLDRTDVVVLRMLVNTYKLPIKSENGLFLGAEINTTAENIDYLRPTPQHNILLLIHLLLSNVLTRVIINTPEAAVLGAFVASVGLSSVNAFMNNVNDETVEQFSASKNVIFSVYLPGVLRVVKLLVAYVAEGVREMKKDGEAADTSGETQLSLALIPNNVEYVTGEHCCLSKIYQGLIHSLLCMLKGLVITYGADSHFLLYPKLMAELLLLFRGSKDTVNDSLWDECVELLEGTIYTVTRRIVNTAVLKVLGREAVATTNEGDKGIRELEPDFELHYDPKDISSMGINDQSTPQERMRMDDRRKKLLAKKAKNERRHYEKSLRQQTYLQQQAAHTATAASREAADSEYKALLSTLQKDAAEFNKMDRIEKEMRRGFKR